MNLSPLSGIPHSSFLHVGETHFDEPSSINPRTQMLLALKDKTHVEWNNIITTPGEGAMWCTASQVGNLIALSESRLCKSNNKTSFYKHAIYVYTETGHSSGVLRGMRGFVTCMTSIDNLLFTGSNDKSIYIWKLQSDANEFLFDIPNVHEKGATCLDVAKHPTQSGYRLVSGSKDCQIKIWHITEKGYKLERVLEGHTESIEEVQIKENCLYSASLDKTVRIWDSDTGQCLHTFSSPFSEFCSVQVSENKMAGSDKEGYVYVWDIDSKQLLHMNKIHQVDGYTSVLISDHLVLSVGRDRNMFLFDINDGSQTFVGWGDQIVWADSEGILVRGKGYPEKNDISWSIVTPKPVYDQGKT